MRKRLIRQMPKILIGILIALVLALGVYAQQESVGELEYSFNDDGTCSVIGIGSYEGTDIVIPSVYNGYSVTRIEDKAFYDNTEITSVTAPSVKSIGDLAFHYCISLESITFNQVEIIEDSAFYFCTELTDVNLGEHLEIVERYAFYSCVDIDVLTLPNTTRELKEAAFKYCSNIVKLTLGEVLGTSKDESNNADLVASDAFAECNKIVEVYNYSKYDLYFGGTEAGGAGTYAIKVHTSKEPSILTWTEDGYVFATMNGVNLLVSQIGKETELVLPSSFNGSKYIINHFAFVNRTSLEKIDLGTGITVIGAYAFEFCANVKYIKIPEGVSQIGGLAFNECHLLKSIDLPSTLESIGEGAFQNCYDLKSIKIPSGVTEIQFGTFISCFSLESIALPSTITTIGDNVFQDCDSLTSIVLPSSIKNIGDEAFSYCDKLKFVYIPKGISYIGKKAFISSPELTVYCEDSEPSANWNTLWNVDNHTIKWNAKLDLSRAFTFLGYSSNGNMVSAGFSIDHLLLEMFEKENGITADIGIIFASYQLLDGKNPLDEACNPTKLDVGMVIKTSLRDKNYLIYDVIITDLTPDLYDHPFVISAYVYDGKTINYVQDNSSDTVSGISYNEIISKIGEKENEEICMPAL